VHQLNLPAAASKIAEEQNYLHWMMMGICLAIFVAVFGVMFYSIFHHRKSRGHQPATFHESVKVELIWTIVPFIIVILMAVPATKMVVAQKDTSAADITIKATGYQWRWGYEYLSGEGNGINFVSSLDHEHRQISNDGAKGVSLDNYLLKVDNPMVVPVGKKVRVITTAADVIHAFAVQSLGIKQDAIPGFVRDTWFKAERTGDFYGQCQELCGKEHAYMPIHVKVLSQEDYSAWVKSRQEPKAAAAGKPLEVAQSAN
jgi:cytochrome c oxidase subunit 2